MCAFVCARESASASASSRACSHVHVRVDLCMRVWERVRVRVHAGVCVRAVRRLRAQTDTHQRKCGRSTNVFMGYSFQNMNGNLIYMHLRNMHATQHHPQSHNIVQLQSNRVAGGRPCFLLPAVAAAPLSHWRRTRRMSEIYYETQFDALRQMSQDVSRCAFQKLDHL